MDYCYPENYGCPVPGCPVPGDIPEHPPCPPPPPPYPDPHDPAYWADEGRYPRPPEKQYCPPKKPPEMPKPTVVPPPIPPVRYIPGMDVQEQLSNMAGRVNDCVNRWNHIQAECFRALDRVVGAAVSNDVYYEPEEVRFSTGYSSADGANYEIIEARPVDKAGRPIVMQLMTAYMSGDSNVRESILQKSFVASANAIITAVSPTEKWAGVCVVAGNPQATNTPVMDSWLVGWTRQGAMRILPAAETSIETVRRNQIVDCIGPVTPLVMNGEITIQAKNYPAAPGAVQAIGYKSCNGNKVMFSCGFEDNPGCSVVNVAKILQSMGCTTAVMTCYMSDYPAAVSASADELENTPVLPEATVINTVGQTQSLTKNGVVPTPWVNQNDPLSGNTMLGLTGGMAYIGKLADRPLNYQIPQNAAFWVISKKPGPHWPNRWTGEIADICQRLGSNATELDSVQGKIDIEQKQILDLQGRVGKLETNDAKQDQLLQNHETRISSLENRMDMAEKDITDLQAGLAKETQERIAADNDLNARLQQEITDRIDGDNHLSNQVNQLRTALTDEITARNQADVDLNNAILNEQNARIAADTQLQTLISLKETQLRSEIAKETQDRINADNVLQASLDREEQARELMDTTIIGMIKNETSNRQDEDQKLQDQITDLQNAKVKVTNGIATFTALTPSGETSIGVVVGPGLKTNENNALTLNLSDCFEINEEGELEMACCSKGPGFQAGTGLDFSANPETGELTLNATGGGTSVDLEPATKTKLGGVKIGNNVNASADGTISVDLPDPPEPYELPVASADELGGVKIGDNINVDADGTISTHAPYVLPVASATVLGGVRAGKNIIIDDDGIINAEIPDIEPGEGDTVLTGTGIHIEKDAAARTATISVAPEVMEKIDKIDTLESGLADVEKDIDEIDTKNTEQDTAIAANTVAISANTAAISANAANIKTNADDIKTAQDDITAAQYDISQLTNAVDGLKNDVKDAADKADAAQDTAEDAADKAASAEQAVADLEDKVTAINTDLSNYVQTSGADMTGSLNFAQPVSTFSVGDKPTVKGLPEPTEPDEAANKKYVDDAVAAASVTGDYLPLTGGTVTGTVEIDGAANALALNNGNAHDNTNGAIRLTAENSGVNIRDVSGTDTAAPKAVRISGVNDPKNPSDVANKAYVDAAVSSGGSGTGDYLPLDGGTMTGDITMGTSTNQNFSNNISLKPGNAPNALVVTKSTADIKLTGANSTLANPDDNSAIVRGVSTPVFDTDAANKSYVDEQDQNIATAVSIAQSAADAAKTAADTAQSSADAASLAAAAADAKAADAKTAADLAKTTADSAKTAADDAASAAAAAQTAANAAKSAADSATSAVEGGPFLPLSGGTVTGNLVIDTSSNNSNFSNVLQLNTNSPGMIAFSKSGNSIKLTATGANNSITSSVRVNVGGVATPILAHHAANKEYVDEKIGYTVTNGLFTSVSDFNNIVTKECFIAHQNTGNGHIFHIRLYVLGGTTRVGVPNGEVITIGVVSNAPFKGIGSEYVFNIGAFEISYDGSNQYLTRVYGNVSTDGILTIFMKNTSGQNWTSGRAVLGLIACNTTLFTSASDTLAAY